MQSGNGRGVQQAEVSGAADALLAQGLRPTVERVRRQLGRGSPNTVSPMLETWFAGLAPRLGVSASETNIDPQPAELRQAMDTLWQRAQEIARREAQASLGAEQELLQAQQQLLSNERDGLAREATALAEREALGNAAVARAQGHADDLALQLRELRNTLQQRDSELGTVRLSLARTAEAKDAAQLEYQLSIQSLTDERLRLEERYSTTERWHLEEVDRARQETRAAQKLAKEREERAAAQRKAWDKSMASANGQIQALTTESAGLRASLAASEKQVHDLRELAIAARSTPASKRTRRSKTAA